MGYYLENLYKPNPDSPVKQALSTRHNFRTIIEKLNNTMAVVNNLVIRNNIVYTYIESVDSTHPFEIDFHIPTTTDVIKKISLTLKGVPFRAYSKAGAAAGSASGGSSTPTSESGGVVTSAGGGVVSSESGGGETPTTTQESGRNTGIQNASHNHPYTAPAPYTGTENGNHAHNIPQHTHTVTIAAHTHTGGSHTHTGGAHTHVVTIAAHTHPNHTHTAVYGIYESTTPTAVNGYYDDGGGYSAADSYGNAPDTTTPWNIKAEYDITDKYSGTGWKRLKLDTSRLGRFNVILIIEVDLTPTA